MKHQLVSLALLQKEQSRATMPEDDSIMRRAWSTPLTERVTISPPKKVEKPLKGKKKPYDPKAKLAELGLTIEEVVTEFHEEKAEVTPKEVEAPRFISRSLQAEMELYARRQKSPAKVIQKPVRQVPKKHDPNWQRIKSIKDRLAKIKKKISALEKDKRQTAFQEKRDKIYFDKIKRREEADKRAELRRHDELISSHCFGSLEALPPEDPLIEMYQYPLEIDLMGAITVKSTDPKRRVRIGTGKYPARKIEIDGIPWIVTRYPRLGRSEYGLSLVEWEAFMKGSGGVIATVNGL